MEELSEADLQLLRSWLGSGSINIFGIQFSGKDTVANTLQHKLGSIIISSGDVMRHIYTGKRSALDDTIHKASAVGALTGALMPTNEFQRMMIHRLAEPDLIGRSIILSSVGRWIGEEKPIMEALDASNHGTKAVILLNISEETAWKRWRSNQDGRNGGRHDDMNKETVERRINEYKNKTLPVIQVYRDMGILLEINGEQPREAVLNDTLKALYSFSRKV